MESEPRRRTFTLKDLLAATAVIGVLSAVFLPLLREHHTDHRRFQCSNHLKQLGLGLQNYHDLFKCFPALSNQGSAEGSANVWQTAPGETFLANRLAPNGHAESPASAAGYSWIVMILPYVEETVLYNQVNSASRKLEYEAFSATGIDGRPFDVTINNAAWHFATVQLDEVECYGYAGDRISTASSGTAGPPVSIPSYAKLFNASTQPPSGVVISNYVALPATHLACMALGPNDTATASAEPPNGVIVPGKGVNVKAVRDGTSKTLILCETKEPAVNSWYDGTVCWTVGANPSASSQPIWRASPTGTTGAATASGWWAFPPGTTNAAGLNYGPDKNKNTLFAPNGTTPAQTQPVSWGPSSDHPGGVVMHLACDCSVHVIFKEIDPTLYINLITRAGSEPVMIPDFP